MLKKRQTINAGYSGGFGAEPKRSRGGKFKLLLIVIVLFAAYLVYFWISNPAYSPSWVRDLLPNAPQRMYQYENNDGEIVESRFLPPGRNNAKVINRWDNKTGILPE